MLMTVIDLLSFKFSDTFQYSNRPPFLSFVLELSSWLGSARRGRVRGRGRWRGLGLGLGLGLGSWVLGLGSWVLVEGLRPNKILFGPS